MTYKKIVEGFISRDSFRWVEKLMNENGIEFQMTLSPDTIELEQENGWTYYSCWVEIVFMDYTRKTVEVGGTVDDWGIHHGVIWDDQHQTIWMAARKTRDAIGITEFNLV